MLFILNERLRIVDRTTLGVLFFVFFKKRIVSSVGRISRKTLLNEVKWRAHNANAYNSTQNARLSLNSLEARSSCKSLVQIRFLFIVQSLSYHGLKEKEREKECMMLSDADQERVTEREWGIFIIGLNSINNMVLAVLSFDALLFPSRRQQVLGIAWPNENNVANMSCMRQTNRIAKNEKSANAMHHEFKSSMQCKSVSILKCTILCHHCTAPNRTFMKYIFYSAYTHTHPYIHTQRE